MTQREKAEKFFNLHHDGNVLILLNSWDPGTSKLAEAMGFKAVATTSMGVAASLGYADCQATPFNEMHDAIKRIVDKVTVPVTADIEGGYAGDTEKIVENIKKLAGTGLVGINIEDSIDLNPALIDTNVFSERLRAIRKMSDSLGFHLFVNARTDVFLANWGDEDKRLAEAVRRGNLYREAGADCVFIPRVWERNDISVLAKEINAPVNIVCNPTNGAGVVPSIHELKELGVARLSVGSTLMKTTLALVKTIGDELLQKGTYNALSDAATPLENVLEAYQMAVRNKQ